MPRRLTNHSEVSATSGAKLALLPKRPMNRPCTKAKLPMPVAMPLSTKPRHKLAAPMSSGTITPNRSARRPIRMPPSPKPIIKAV